MISANGIELNYRLETPRAPSDILGDNVSPAPKKLSTVVLSHSLATHLGVWEPQVQALLPYYRVVRYDIRGHGGSAVPEGPYQLEQLVEDVKGLLAGLGIERAHFVGLSLGGMVGQLLAATYPELVEGLVLCSTTCYVGPEAHPVWDERIAIAGTKGMEPHVESTIARWFTPSFIAERPEVVNPVREMIRGTNPRGYVGCAQVVRNLDLRDRLQDIESPTLVMVGAEDPGTPLEAAAYLQGHIKGARLQVLSSASHLANLEQPQGFNKTLLEFLASVEE